MIIHRNRWMWWAVAAVIAAGLGFAAMAIHALREIDEHTAEIAKSASVWKTFSSEEMGFSLKYPASWEIEFDREEPNTVAFQNPANFAENISAAATDTKYLKLIRDSLSVKSRRTDTVDGKPAEFYKLSGSEAVLVSVNGRLYYFSGQARLFEKIVKSLKFFSPLK